MEQVRHIYQIEGEFTFENFDEKAWLEFGITLFCSARIYYKNNKLFTEIIGSKQTVSFTQTEIIEDFHYVIFHIQPSTILTSHYIIMTSSRPPVSHLQCLPQTPNGAADRCTSWFFRDTNMCDNQHVVTQSPAPIDRTSLSVNEST